MVWSITHFWQYYGTNKLWFLSKQTYQTTSQPVGKKASHFWYSHFSKIKVLEALAPKFFVSKWLIKPPKDCPIGLDTKPNTDRQFWWRCFWLGFGLCLLKMVSVSLEFIQVMQDFPTPKPPPKYPPYPCPLKGKFNSSLSKLLNYPQ